ncbi:hypothetical protein BKA81DRAFT_228376 [Phyllosticta paracitricarpa]
MTKFYADSDIPDEDLGQHLATTQAGLCVNTVKVPPVYLIRAHCSLAFSPSVDCSIPHVAARNSIQSCCSGVAWRMIFSLVQLHFCLFCFMGMTHCWDWHIEASPLLLATWLALLFLRALALATRNTCRQFS